MYPEKQLVFRSEPLLERKFTEGSHDEALKIVVVDASWKKTGIISANAVHMGESCIL